MWPNDRPLASLLCLQLRHRGPTQCAEPSARTPPGLPALHVCPRPASASTSLGCRPHLLPERWSPQRPSRCGQWAISHFNCGLSPGPPSCLLPLNLSPSPSPPQWPSWGVVTSVVVCGRPPVRGRPAGHPGSRSLKYRPQTTEMLPPASLLGLTHLLCSQLNPNRAISPLTLTFVSN